LGWRRFVWLAYSLPMSAEEMRGDVNSMRWSDRFAVVALLSLSVLVSGCGGGSVFGGPSATAPTPANTATAPAPTSTAAAPPPAAPPSSGGWLRSDLSSFFSGSTASAPQQVAGAPPDVECPYIQIREGASTLVIGAGGGGDNGAMSLKYQGTFVRAARQCAVVAGQMVMKVGVEGRIILGPAGGPGQIDVPLRIAVVDESPAGAKPIVTKLIHIPVVVQSATDNPSFAHVEDGLTFPLPGSSTVLSHYVIYIGFDPLAAEPQAKPKDKRKAAPKPAPGTG
jgi:hypothetical protein